MVKLILMLITLKPKNQYFKGYLMLETLLNYLRELINPGTILKLFVDLELALITIVLLASCRFVVDLLNLNFILILVLLHSIMLLKRSFIL